VDGHLFIAPGDITQLSADAVAFSASSALSRDGNLYSSFQANVPGFAEWYAGLSRRQGRFTPPGTAFWMPLHADRRPHGVAVAVSTGGRATSEDKAALAVRAALHTAVEQLRAEGRGGRLLVALPAFRVGGGGDRQHRLRSATVQVRAALDFLAQTPGVDVAFITYTPTLYRIFLEARRRVLGPPPADPLQRPELEDALRAGEGVLFAGAGLSRGAGLPDWGALMARLAGDLGLPPDPRVDYLDLAQWYRERFGPAALAGVVRETFAAPSLPTLAHYLLLALPVRHVLTTNYDDLLERALTALKRHPVAVARQEEVAHTGQAGVVYVTKLHGDAARPEEIVLCRDDYDRFFERRPAMALLLEGLLLNQTFFFVGYGLRDPNFRQIYSRIGRMLPETQRPAFATTFEAGGAAGPHLVEQWRRKRLHLIPVPGATAAEQEQEFLRFLDRLADRVTMQTPRLFLAPDVDVSPGLSPLRALLVEGVGRETGLLGRRDLSGPEAATDVQYLAGVLEFLTNHGWRPAANSGWPLCRLWEHLAAHAPDPRERRRLLTLALATAETFGDAERIRGQLTGLSGRSARSPTNPDEGEHA
jgi:hypothetical protein